MGFEQSPEGHGRFDVTITPKGMRVRAPRLAETGRIVARTLHKTAHLIRLELRQLSFGLYFGNLWLLLEPALQAAAYYFLLKVVFSVSGADSTFAFFFIGITFWRSHATLAASAAYFLTSRGYYYVEQGFGLSIAYLEVLANEIVLLFVRLLVLGFFLIVAGYPPLFAWPLVLLVAAVQFVFSMAVHIWLSMLGVVIKDSGKIIGHIVWLWWYMSPGLYSIRRIPDWAMTVYNLNPFAHLMPAYHSLLLHGSIETNVVIGIGVVLAGSLVLLWAGLVQLRRFSYSMPLYI